MASCSLFLQQVDMSASYPNTLCTPELWVVAMPVWWASCQVIAATGSKQDKRCPLVMKRCAGRVVTEAGCPPAPNGKHLTSTELTR